MQYTRSTFTTVGEVRHAPHKAGFMMPVAVEMQEDTAAPPKPVIERGQFVYALPGGGRCVRS